MLSHSLGPNREQSFAILITCPLGLLPLWNLQSAPLPTLVVLVSISYLKWIVMHYESPASPNFYVSSLVP